MKLKKKVAVLDCTHLSALATIFLFTGCWQEVHYTGPAPGSTVAQSAPASQASPEIESPDSSSTEERRTVDSSSVESTSDSNASTPPAAAGGLFDEVAPAPDAVPEVAPLPSGAESALDEGFAEADAAPAEQVSPVPGSSPTEPVVGLLPEAESTEPVKDYDSGTPTANLESLLPASETDSPPEQPVAELPKETPPAVADVPKTADLPVAEAPVAVEPPAASVPAVPADTRRAAFTLGSKLSLAALANDRGLAADKVAQFMAEAKQAAGTLGTHVNELPPRSSAAAASADVTDIHDYLFQEGKRIWQDLVTKFGPDHAALFEVAMKSNALLALYGNDAKAPDAISGAISQRAPAARLPEELWRPLIDAIAKRAKPAEVRAAVYRFHADVDKYLAAGKQ